MVGRPHRWPTIEVSDADTSLQFTPRRGVRASLDYALLEEVHCGQVAELGKVGGPVTWIPVVHFGQLDEVATDPHVGFLDDRGQIPMLDSESGTVQKGGDRGRTDVMVGAQSLAFRLVTAADALPGRCVAAVWQQQWAEILC